MGRKAAGASTTLSWLWKRLSRSPRCPSPSGFSGSSSAPRSAGGWSPTRAASAGTRPPRRPSAGSGSSQGSSPESCVALAVGALEWSGELGGILAGCALLFAAGLLDDLRHLSPLVKLALQIGAAVIVLASGLQVEIVGNDVLAWGIGILWLVGITNAFNLLDNMDGLAATLAAIACGYFAIDAATEHPNDTVLTLAVALGLACVAFLPFNLRPGRGAHVFMGDSGSQVLGFALASFALASSWTVAGTTVATVLLPLLILAIPILDTTLVTIRRILERRPVSQGGRDHTSHRLVYYGLSEAKAVLLLALVAAAIGATALAYNVLDNSRLTAFGVLAHLRPARPVRELPERPRGADATRRPGARGVALEGARVRAAPPDRGRRRLRRDLRVVPRRVRARDRRAGDRVRALGVPGRAPDPARDALRVLRRARACTGACGGSRPPATSSRSRSAASGPASWRCSCWTRCARSAVPGDRGVRRRRRAVHAARRRLAAHAAAAAGDESAAGGGTGSASSSSAPGAQDAGSRASSATRTRPASSASWTTTRAFAAAASWGSPSSARSTRPRARLASSRADEVLVTIPGAPQERLDAVVRAAEEAGVPCRFVHRRTEFSAPEPVEASLALRRLERLSARAPAPDRLLRSRDAVRVAGVAASGADDLLRRDRARAALALDRGDGGGDAEGRPVRAGDARRVLPRSRVVARRGDGLRGREAPARPRDDRDDLPGVRARALRRSAVVRARRGDRRDDRAGARVLADPRRGAARVPAVDARPVVDRARLRGAELGPRRAGRARVRRSDADADAAVDPVRALRDRPRLARMAVGAVAPLARDLVALGLGRARHAPRRLRGGHLGRARAPLPQLARDDRLLRGADRRARCLGFRARWRSGSACCR